MTNTENRGSQTIQKEWIESRSRWNTDRDGDVKMIQQEPDVTNSSGCNVVKINEKKMASVEKEISRESDAN